MPKIKNLIKRIPFLLNLKRKIYDALNIKDRENPAFGSTKLNILHAFPAYIANSSGTYSQRSELTINTINNLFYSLNFLQTGLKNVSNLKDFNNLDKEKFIKSNIENPKDFAIKNNSYDISRELEALFNQYGSDKSRTHNYHLFYAPMIKNRNEVTKIVEVGIGSNYTDQVSNMGVKGTPGASLRAFKNFCPNALIIGADVDKRILFNEDRIETYFVDQTKISSLELLADKIGTDIDLLIDDGLHSPDANINTLSIGISRVKKGGWIVIEDIVLEAFNIWKFLKTLLEVNNKFECHLFRSGNSKRFVFAAMKRNL